MRGNRVITLDGFQLTIPDLVLIADGRSSIALDDAGYQRMVEAREIIETAFENNEPVYGLTTGLGAKVSQKLEAAQLTEFSRHTLRGRAHAMGDPLSTPLVRAAMVVRLNGLLRGMSGGSPGVADFLRSCLIAGITPVVGSIGSIGASDLCLGATMGLALIGEGKMADPQGVIGPSAQILKQSGITPLQLGPRDGLALASNSAFSAAMAGFAIYRSQTLFDCVQTAAAMTMEALTANLSPLESVVLTANPQPGQIRVAKQLRENLSGSELFIKTNEKRLQDPLSIRNIVQVHGALNDALTFATPIVEIEINASSDNPVVDVETRRVISCGAYLTSHLTMVLETVSRTIVQVVMAQIARMSKLLSQRHSGLPLFLAKGGANSNGFAPYMKIAESLASEITHLAMPVSIWPSVNADGSEDVLSNAVTAAKALDNIAELAVNLSAIEMIMASQALELQTQDGTLREGVAPMIGSAYQKVRSLVPPLESSRPGGEDIERLARYLMHEHGSEFRVKNSQ